MMQTDQPARTHALAGYSAVKESKLVLAAHISQDASRIYMETGDVSCMGNSDRRNGIVAVVISHHRQAAVWVGCLNKPPVVYVELAIVYVHLDLGRRQPIFRIFIHQ
ncbi:unnamed protein product, partial [Linum tenue]